MSVYVHMCVSNSKHRFGKWTDGVHRYFFHMLFPMHSHHELDLSSLYHANIFVPVVPVFEKHKEGVCCLVCVHVCVHVCTHVHIYEMFVFRWFFSYGCSFSRVFVLFF